MAFARPLSSSLIAQRSSLALASRAVILITIPLLLVSSGCSDKNKVILTPPFDGHAKIGEVTASWQTTGEERAFAEGRKLETPEVRFQYRIDVRNRLEDKMFVRLSEFRLMNAGGGELAKDVRRVDCILSVGDSSGVIRGEVWVAKDAADDISGFGITHFSVPLGEIGRGHYREWALQGRTGDAATVDAEIAGYAAAPACPAG
jgi:hypothetical protein